MATDIRLKGASSEPEEAVALEASERGARVSRDISRSGVYRSAA
jgi:hypothetical protein